MAKILNYEGELLSELILSIIIFFRSIFILQPSPVCEDRLGKAEGVANPLPLLPPDKKHPMTLYMMKERRDMRKRVLAANDEPIWERQVS